jgi:hypothetical protein
MRQKIERKAVLLNVFFVLVVFICPWTALSVGIDAVDVIPSQPTETDIITFDVNGWAGLSTSWVEYDDFSQDGSLLQLDLYINADGFRSISEWTYSKQISALPADTYTLEVNAYNYYFDGSLDDTYIVEFTVVPEPASIALLSFGLCLLSRASRRKK